MDIKVKIKMDRVGRMNVVEHYKRDRKGFKGLDKGQTWIGKQGLKMIGAAVDCIKDRRKLVWICGELLFAKLNEGYKKTAAY